MKRYFIFTTCLLFCLFGCKEDDAEPDTNGFTINGKFYGTKYAYYQNSGSDRDFAFMFSNYEIQGENFTVTDSSAWNIFGFSDLTLRSEDEFVGTYFYDNTESLPGGIDSFGCRAEGSHYPSNIASSAETLVVNIVSKSGSSFVIEYDASFPNGPSITGTYAGNILFLQ